jgi:hypothetical protein
MYTSVALIAVLWLQVPPAIPAGTSLTAKLERTVKTATSQVGEEVVASVAKNILWADIIVVPAGSTLRGRVETIRSATRDTEGRVRLVFREIQFPDNRRIQTWITNSFTADTPKRAARYIVYTALAATAGGLIGGRNARVAGILGGTIVGFVLAGSGNARKLPDLTLKPGQHIQLELGEDLVISSAR